MFSRFVTILEYDKRMERLANRQADRQITYNKPVDELTCALLSFKRLLLSVDVMVDMHDGVERYLVHPC